MGSKTGWCPKCETIQSLKDGRITDHLTPIRRAPCKGSGGPPSKDEPR